MITVDDFIKELSSISEEKRKLPLVIQCPNGQITDPNVKMLWDDISDYMQKTPDKMIITWQD